MPARGRGHRLQPRILTADERAELERLTHRHPTAQHLTLPSSIVLRSAGGASNRAVAEALGVHEDTVSISRGRFLRRRLDDLADEPHPGALRKVTDARVERVVTRTLESTPPGQTH